MFALTLCSHILDIQGKQGVLALPHMMVATAFQSRQEITENCLDGRVYLRNCFDHERMGRETRRTFVRSSEGNGRCPKVHRLSSCLRTKVSSAHATSSQHLSVTIGG